MLVLGLNHARNVSLNTSVVTHQSSKWVQWNNNFTLSFFLSCSFSLSFFLSLFFFKSLNSSFQYCNNKNKGIAAHSFTEQIENLQRYCEALKSNLGTRSDPLERPQDKLSRLYLNSELDIKHKIYGYFLLVLNWERWIHGGKMAAEKWMVLVDFVVSKNMTELKTLKNNH
jgi:hypothetical protein